VSKPQAASLSATGIQQARVLWEKLKEKAFGTDEERLAEWKRRQEAVSRYAAGQLWPKPDTLRRIAFVWKRSDYVPRRYAGNQVAGWA